MRRRPLKILLVTDTRLRKSDEDVGEGVMKYWKLVYMFGLEAIARCVLYLPSMKEDLHYIFVRCFYMAASVSDLIKVSLLSTFWVPVARRKYRKESIIFHHHIQNSCIVQARFA